MQVIKFVLRPFAKYLINEYFAIVGIKFVVTMIKYIILNGLIPIHMKRISNEDTKHRLVC